MTSVIKVGIADLNICKAPNSLSTFGLGSCVGILLYDPINKIAGLAHIMLPYHEQIYSNMKITAFANTSIELLLFKMLKAGANKSNIISKISGGSRMFNLNISDCFNIGEKNIIAIRNILREYNISIVAEDIGGNYSRNIEFFPETGDLIIKAIGREMIII